MELNTHSTELPSISGRTPVQTYERAPRAAKYLKYVLEPFDRLFDWAFRSTYNPLYRSGTLAVGLLAVVFVTGLILIFYYRIGAPYESMTTIQNDVWIARWLRALHRYASDAAMVGTLFHALRMMIEGKTWGPRVLAWVSGVILLGMMLVSGITGYIMVWDRHGQEVALSLFRMLDVLPIFADPTSRMLSGTTLVGSSFFFSMLFLHVAVPLGMLAAIWIHTQKLARSVWLPWKPIFVWSTVALTLYSILFPAPLAGPTNLLLVGGKVPVDWWYSFWMGIEWKLGPAMGLLATFSLFLVAGLAPLYWRPRKSSIAAPSLGDQSKCTGCGQCLQDCPFEAISMVPRKEGKGSEVVSFVNSALCTSCGICAGSCSQFAIGPKSRTGRDELDWARSLKGEGTSDAVLLISCRNTGAGINAKDTIQKIYSNVQLWAVDCTGSIHSGVITYLLNNFKGVMVVGCPPRQCLHREGHSIFMERVFGGREPKVSSRLDVNRVRAISASVSESSLVTEEFRKFLSDLGISKSEIGQKTTNERVNQLAQGFKGFLVAGAFLSVMAFFSQLEGGLHPTSSFVRVALRLPGQVVKICRDRTPEELAQLRPHMRTPTVCTQTNLSYKLEIFIDGGRVQERVVAPTGAKGDRPLSVSEDFPISPGRHHMQIKFLPIDDATQAGIPLETEFDADFKLGHAVLVGFEPTDKKLFFKEE